MPYAEMPKFKNVPDKMLEIPSPAIGGLNTKNIEFELDVAQSPYMLNMMYDNGVLGKRYGQEIYASFSRTVGGVVYRQRIFTSIHFGGHLFLQLGDGTGSYTLIAMLDDVTEGVASYSTLTSVQLGLRKGQFIVFNQELYFILPNDANGNYGRILKFNGDYTTPAFAFIDPYIPDVFINCTPDGTTHAEQFEEFNILPQFIETQSSSVTRWKFAMVYNADGTSDKYYPVAKFRSYIAFSMDPTVYVEDVEMVKGTDYEYTSENKYVKFNAGHIPQEGQLNVRIVWTLKTSNTNVKKMVDEYRYLLKAKYHATYGATGNGRLFLGGCGNNKYYWSEPWKMNYFPETNWALLGHGEDDITGFGKQFNTLFIFKPRELFSLFSYTHDAYTTVNEEQIGEEDFKTMLVNDSIGCDAPYSIQLIDNHLTWFNSKKGVCTLASTSIADERNVRVISTNIEKTSASFNIIGLLDIEEDPANIRSADFDNKYFLVFPTYGICYVWDYEISPFIVTTTSTTDPQKLAWFRFDNFFVGDFQQIGNELYYSVCYGNASPLWNRIIKLNHSFDDFNIISGSLIPIDARYMTPFIQFNAVDYLKNVKNIYVQCRGDTATAIDMYYYSEDTESGGVREPESIRIGGKIWQHFRWDTFDWNIIGHATVFRRKCNIKKVQMVSFLFKNNDVGRDLSITHIGLQYQLVKYIR